MPEEVAQSGPGKKLQEWSARVRGMWGEAVVPWAQSNPRLATLCAAVAAVGVLVWIGGAIVMNGLIAGILVSGAAGVLIWKCRSSKNRYLLAAYNVMVEHPLLSDVGLSAIALAMAPRGITGWIAAAITALLASVWLIGASPVEVPPEEQEEEQAEPSLHNTVVEGLNQ